MKHYLPPWASDESCLHNPDNLTPEQVGEGYRLVVGGDSTEQNHELWCSSGKWCSAIEGEGTFQSYFDSEELISTTYRLPLSVPWPENPNVAQAVLDWVKDNKPSGWAPEKELDYWLEKTKWAEIEKIGEPGENRVDAINRFINNLKSDLEEAKKIITYCRPRSEIYQMILKELGVENDAIGTIRELIQNNKKKDSEIEKIKAKFHSMHLIDRVKFEAKFPQWDTNLAPIQYADPKTQGGWEAWCEMKDIK